MHHKSQRAHPSSYASSHESLNKRLSLFRQILVTSLLLLVPFLTVFGDMNSEGLAAEQIFPGSSWETRTYNQVGLDGTKIEEFVTNLSTGTTSAGVVIKDGYLVKTWGSPSGKIDWGSARKPVISDGEFLAPWRTSV
jgi:hypothetical protein